MHYHPYRYSPRAIVDAMGLLGGARGRRRGSASRSTRSRRSCSRPRCARPARCSRRATSTSSTRTGSFRTGRSARWPPPRHGVPLVISLHGSDVAVVRALARARPRVALVVRAQRRSDRAEQRPPRAGAAARRSRAARARAVRRRRRLRSRSSRQAARRCGGSSASTTSTSSSAGVGRLIPVKGFDVPRRRPRRSHSPTIPRLRLVLVGDGELTRPRSRHGSRALGVSDTVVLHRGGRAAARSRRTWPPPTSSPFRRSATAATSTACRTSRSRRWPRASRSSARASAGIPELVRDGENGDARAREGLARTRRRARRARRRPGSPLRLGASGAGRDPGGAKLGRRRRALRRDLRAALADRDAQVAARVRRVLRDRAARRARAGALGHGRRVLARSRSPTSGASFDFIEARLDGDVGLADFWAQHNEHRIVVARLQFLADYGLFDGTNVFLFAAIAVVVARARRSSFAAAVYLDTRDRLLALGTLAVGDAATLSPAGWENLTWAFQVQFVQVFLFAVARDPARRRSRRAQPRAGRARDVRCGGARATAATLLDGERAPRLAGRRRAWRSCCRLGRRRRRAGRSRSRRAASSRRTSGGSSSARAESSPIPIGLATFVAVYLGSAVWGAGLSRSDCRRRGRARARPRSSACSRWRQSSRQRRSRSPFGRGRREVHPPDRRCRPLRAGCTSARRRRCPRATRSRASRSGSRCWSRSSFRSASDCERRPNAALAYHRSARRLAALFVGYRTHPRRRLPPHGRLREGGDGRHVPRRRRATTPQTVTGVGGRRLQCGTRFAGWSASGSGRGRRAGMVDDMQVVEATVGVVPRPCARRGRVQRAGRCGASARRLDRTARRRAGVAQPRRARRRRASVSASGSSARIARTSMLGRGRLVGLRRLRSRASRTSPLSVVLLAEDGADARLQARTVGALEDRRLAPHAPHLAERVAHLAERDVVARRLDDRRHEVDAVLRRRRP